MMDKNVSKFNDWLLNEHEEAERLRELNEAFDEKDEKRIKDLIAKVDKQNLLGSEKKEKEITLANNMANSITDRNKAIRRGDAAAHLEEDHLAAIFYKRAKELGAKDEDLGISIVDVQSSDDDYTGEKPEEDDEKLDLETDDKAEEAPKKERKKRVPKERPPRPEKLKKGDLVRVTAEMVLDKVVGLHDRKGGWRWILASNTGERILGITDPERATKNYSGQSASSKIDRDYLDEMKGKEPIFYVKVTKLGSQWVEGDPMYFNGLAVPKMPNKIRFQKKYVGPAGPELKIILDNAPLIGLSLNKTKFFIGDEDFLMDKAGKTIDITPGQYVLSALNFELTNKSNKPVIWCYPTRETSNRLKSAKVFFADLDKAVELKDAISDDQMKVVAEYMGKQLGGAEVTVQGSSFKIPFFVVNSDKGKGLGQYSAQPFFSRKQAEDHIEEIKKKAKSEKLPFDADATFNINVVSGWSAYTLDFTQLMDYAKIAGIEVKMREFFEAKKGAVAAKKFGF